MELKKAAAVAAVIGQVVVNCGMFQVVAMPALTESSGAFTTVIKAAKATTKAIAFPIKAAEATKAVTATVDLLLTITG